MILFTGKEPHPIFETLSPENEEKLKKASGEQAVAEYYKTRARYMMLAANDPLRYGYEPPIWKLADQQLEELREKFPFGVVQLLNLGGNRASKTVRAAKRVMQLMCNKPGARVWCLQSTESASRADQQGLIFSHIPLEWRPEGGKLRQGRSTKINYSDAGGFTENTFVLPNGSQCWFKFYGANVKSLEGAELDMVWADELIEPDWIEALRFRLITRNGQLLVTFTPAEGYSSTVAMYRNDEKVLKTQSAELLPEYDKEGNLTGYEEMPRIAQSGIPTARIIYFWTEDNPFGNYEAMKVECAMGNRERTKMRAYGYASKAVASQLNFKPKVHVMSLNALGEIMRQYPNATRYQLVDPCSGRNWFSGYALCPYNLQSRRPDGTIVVKPRVIFYREWPSTGHPAAYIEGIGDPGPWAVAGGTRIRRDKDKQPYDGDPGPAQEPFKFGLSRYMTEFLKIENGETIFERWMDCRYGNAAKTEREGTTTLIEQMSDLGMEFVAMTGEQKILGTPDGSIDMINSALYYDKSVSIGEFSPELGRINEPEMSVVECCPNMIYALEHWTGKDGMHGATKDPIDICRGFFLSGLGYVGPDSMRVKVSGGHY